MKLNLYDFDGTIYDGDSSVDFFMYCLKKEPRMYRLLPKIALGLIKYYAKYLTLTEFKEIIFSYLKYFDNTEELVEDFWKTHKQKIKDFYLKKDHSNDIIISASPTFLLERMAKELKVKDLIASDVDIKTGKFNKTNNQGKEKVVVFKKKYPNASIKEMYSDSMHDKPLLDLAKKSYFVKKNKIYDYRTYKPNIFKRFWDWGWGIYHKNEELWNYLIVGALTTLVSIGSFAIFDKGLHAHYLISNVLSWVLAVLFAYFTNRWFVFHSKNKNKLKEFLSFTGSRVLTLLLDTGLMTLFIEIIHLDSLISKVLVQIVILVSNYVLSKLIVFKKQS